MSEGYLVAPTWKLPGFARLKWEEYREWGGTEKWEIWRARLDRRGTFEELRKGMKPMPAIDNEWYRTAWAMDGRVGRVKVWCGWEHRGTGACVVDWSVAREAKVEWKSLVAGTEAGFLGSLDGVRKEIEEWDRYETLVTTSELRRGLVATILDEDVAKWLTNEQVLQLARRWNGAKGVKCSGAGTKVIRSIWRDLVEVEPVSWGRRFLVGVRCVEAWRRLETNKVKGVNGD